MSVSLSGELVFKVTFDQHGFPIGMYTTAAIIHMCAEQIHASSPFSNPNKPKKLENFMYLGANQDAIFEGNRLGITADLSYNFKASKAGVEGAFNNVVKESMKLSNPLVYKK